MGAKTKRQAIAMCSFCGKPNTDVGRLVAGPGVYICDECVDLCAQIIAGEHDNPAPAESPRPAQSSGSARESGSTQPGIANHADGPEQPAESDHPAESPGSARGSGPGEFAGSAMPRLWDQIDTADAALALLPKMAAAGAQVEQNLTALVRRARALGATWAKIGETLGMTRQSAWERFSGEE